MRQVTVYEFDDLAEATQKALLTMLLAKLIRGVDSGDYVLRSGKAQDIFLEVSERRREERYAGMNSDDMSADEMLEMMFERGGEIKDVMLELMSNEEFVKAVRDEVMEAVYSLEYILDDIYQDTVTDVSSEFSAMVGFLLGESLEEGEEPEWTFDDLPEEVKNVSDSLL